MGIFSNKKEKITKKPEVIDWSKAHKASDQFAKEVFNHLETDQNATKNQENTKSIKEELSVEEQLAQRKQEDLTNVVMGSVSIIAVLVGILYSIVWIGMIIGTILTFVAIGYFITIVLPSYQQGFPINHQERISELIESFSKGYRNALKKEAEKKTVKGRMKRALKTVGEIVMDSD